MPIVTPDQKIQTCLGEGASCHEQHLQGNQHFQWFQFIWWRWPLQTENRLFLLIDPLSVCWLRQHTFPCIIYISPAATDINSHHLKPNHTPYNILTGHDCDATNKSHVWPSPPICRLFFYLVFLFFKWLHYIKPETCLVAFFILCFLFLIIAFGALKLGGAAVCVIAGRLNGNRWARKQRCASRASK